jgi:hypothetical protein
VLALSHTGVPFEEEPLSTPLQKRKLGYGEKYLV